MRLNDKTLVIIVWTILVAWFFWSSEVGALLGGTLGYAAKPTPGSTYQSELHKVIEERRKLCWDSWHNFERECQRDLLEYKGYDKISFCKVWSRPKTKNGMVMWYPDYMLPDINILTDSPHCQ